MPRLRVLTICVLATAALLASVPTATADDLSSAMECDFSVTGLPNSDGVLFVGIGHAYLASDAVRGLHLECDYYYLPNDEVHIAGSGAGPAVVAAGAEITEPGFVITCATLTITWFDSDPTTVTRCEDIPS